MLGIGELVLLFLVFLFTGGALSRLARWALLRRAPGSKQLLWALTDWIKAQWAAADPSAAIDAPSVSQKSTGASHYCIALIPSLRHHLPQLFEEVLDEELAALFQPISDRVLSERSNLNVPKSYRACAVLKRNRS